MTDAVDVLVLATHPDDAEIGCAGTILDLVDAGRTVAVVDMSRGELGTRGTPEQRAVESAAATRLLGLAVRENLGLPDTAVQDDDATLGAVVRVLRRYRPRLLLAPMTSDAHPDHEATGRVARRAFFHAGLRKARPELGPPHRPRLMLCYFANDFAAADVCVDISRYIERKREVVRCYASQLGGDRSHQLRGLDPLERCEARDRYFGSISGCAAAEPFTVDGPLPLAGLANLLT